MKTLILGASTNPERYAYKAAISLLRHQHEIVLLGLRVGNIEGNEILTGKPALEEIDTVTLYVSAKNQPEWYDYIVSLRPRRVIFNPGTENEEFQQKLLENQIEPVEACTLVMLSINSY